MFQGIFITATLFGGKLAGALVQLRGHVGGFFRRAAEGDEDLGELGDFHGDNLIRKARTQESEKS